jgi:hypothetical protein
MAKNDDFHVMMRAIKKLRKSGLSDKERAAYFSSYVDRYNPPSPPQPSKHHMFALRLDAVQFVKEAIRYGIIHTVDWEEVANKLNLNLFNIQEI